MQHVFLSQIITIAHEFFKCQIFGSNAVPARIQKVRVRHGPKICLKFTPQFQEKQKLSKITICSNIKVTINQGFHGCGMDMYTVHTTTVPNYSSFHSNMQRKYPPIVKVFNSN